MGGKTRSDIGTIGFVVELAGKNAFFSLLEKNAIVRASPTVKDANFSFYDIKINSAFRSNR